jgi:hypothetical protein
MKAVKGWMCGCNRTCAAAKTSRVVGDYDKPCFVVPAPLYRQMQRVIKEARQVHKNEGRISFDALIELLEIELEKLKKMRREK